MTEKSTGAGKVRSTAVLTALTTLLLVLSVGLVGIGIAWPGGEADDGTSSQYTSLDPAAPIRLEVPRLEVTAPIVPISVSTEGVLDPPRDAELVGWWNESAKPGNATGQTVITGHTVHTGGGSMNRIGSLEAGDQVDVVSESGRMRYEIDRVRYYSRDDVAEKAEELFGQDRGDGNLVLITCADWNGEYYERNVIAFGTPLGEPKERPTVEPTADQAAG
ncbi:class F sortase [Nocardioides sp. ChNu-153]|uniref:class F sortase n=1 Tax=unclassified Nocardioides TaxID=2615069 RepID=UPI002404FBBB|nr:MULTISPECIES: class F sortase [unclassified Nocardioides]MDF9715050.1 class F sortase [Nocardioides sp. ChNu-99]MDN7122319.1 class F sortase [Nocardioides sp. ChNu-153]